MKNIIVPIDFTTASMNALRYAHDAFPAAQIKLLHVVPSALNTSNLPKPSLHNTEIVEDKMVQELKNLVKLDFNVKIFPENFDVQIRKGDIAFQVNKFVKENNAACIIMGTRDKYDLIEKALGTVSFSVVKTVDIPIYLIPKDAKYKKYKKVVVATDSDIKKNHFSKMVKEWNKPFNAFVSFIHVSKKEDSYLDETIEIVDELFEKDEPTFGFEINRVTSRKTEKSLLEAAETYNADLLITMPTKQSFIGTLLFKSVTKDLILKSKLPLLFLNPSKTF